MRTLLTLLRPAVALVLIIGALLFSHYVWRLQHPTAPGWTFFFSH